MPASAIFRIFAGINKAFAVGLDELVELAVVDVVAVGFTRQHGAQRVMKIVIPLAIERESAALPRPYQARVIGCALGKQKHLAVEVSRLLVHSIGKLFEERVRGVVEDRMDGVEP